MQTETVQQFYEAVYKNKDTRNRLEEIAEKYLANNPDLDARIHVVNTHIIPMAQELGYDISIDDIRQYEEEMAKALNINDDIDEKELETVHGGAAAACFCVGIGVGGGLSALASCVVIGFGAI